MMKGQKIISHYDLMNYTPQELKQKYKMTGNQLEKQVRINLDGITPKYKDEMEQFYDKVYKKD